MFLANLNVVYHIIKSNKYYDRPKLTEGHIWKNMSFLNEKIESYQSVNYLKICI